MQNINKAIQGQSFIDMVCQLTGSYEECVRLSVMNNRAITDDLVIGDSIINDKISNDEIVKVLKSNRPATALKNLSEVEKQEGIGYWAIQHDFKIL